MCTEGSLSPSPVIIPMPPSRHNDCRPVCACLSKCAKYRHRNSTRNPCQVSQFALQVVTNYICISSVQYYFAHSDDQHMFCIFMKANTPNEMHLLFCSFDRCNSHCTW
ncbi:hypothetical protein AMECASPLE_022929 [Ameca splendens]|uniref:Uncharacterized protein n=1 Tax=Ameca splendens TaxID=208324 RepID=A0ABV0YG47_9TELE